MLLELFAAATLSVTAALALYLRRIPEGTACPRCGEDTRGEDGSRGVAVLLDRWTAARRCPACAWRGRSRLGGGPRRVWRGPPRGAP